MKVMAVNNSISVMNKEITVAIVGRPNVGKSTLVNRIVGKRVAIVEEMPGVTRDRLYLSASWNGRTLNLIDTGGIAEGGSSLDKKVSQQSFKAVKEANVVLLVLDSATGVTFEDENIIKALRKDSDKVILVANKVDSQKQEANALEFYAVGFGDPSPISALHGRGTGDLLDRVVKVFDKLYADNLVDANQLPIKDLLVDEAEENSELEIPDMDIDLSADYINDETDPDSAYDRYNDEVASAGQAELAVAIVGRPNVGKSTLYNLLVGDERSIVHDMPGTTRDAIDTVITTEFATLRLIDTAGMRRKTNIVEGAEYYSLVRSLAAIDRSDVVLLMIDATEGVTHQEQSLSERIDASGSPIVVVANKWDLLSTEERLAANGQLKDKLYFLSYAPTIRISAKTGLGVNKLLPVIQAAIDAYNVRIPTAKLNEAIKMAHAGQPPAKGRILYAVQGGINPPTITLFTSAQLQPSYIRYIERFLRNYFNFGPTPIKFRVRIR